MAVRRLRIIDIKGGDQPLFSEDSSLVLVANGEIYNYVELRAELEARGHLFKTRSDCETILHLYEESGAGCLSRLRGMFAFALHDTRRGELLIARDRMGEKPLYYSAGSSEFIFSSELKSLLAGLGPGRPELEPAAVNMYLHYQYVPEPLTLVKGVRKLPAAHYIKLRTADLSFSLEKYWDLEDAAPVSGNPGELIRAAFDDLGRYIIRADVPVGVALSGGLDSSAIACAAARHSPGGMTAFSVGYPGRPACDERSQAQDLAGRLGMRFVSAELDTAGMVAAFPEMVYAMDDPVADVAAYGYYSVSRLARENGVPVLLLGFGGDELFWGYRWARESLKRNFLKKQLRAGAPFHGLPPRETAALLAAVSKRGLLSDPLAEIARLRGAMAELRAKFAENPDRFILWDENPDFKAAFGFKRELGSGGFGAAADDAPLYAPFTTRDWSSVPLKTCRFLLDPWNVSNSVVQGDRLGMAFSVESRLPFLDCRFVELVTGLRKTYPDDYLLGAKGWFREAMKGIVPDDVLARPKTGFTPPRDEWLRAVNSRYGALCSGGAIEASGLMSPAKLAAFFRDPDGAPGKAFFSYKLVLLELWLRRFISGEAA
ncbi:MAG: asparagine synthase (glutamine-hydrolyzing) [Elusimicrobia bacterium GWB2_63_22]|nr:MAG: asparagine synthase (glutamine-hydrolyzing) [Elusimicrobia bacterium GWB2_63_22]